MGADSLQTRALPGANKNQIWLYGHFALGCKFWLNCHLALGCHFLLGCQISMPCQMGLGCQFLLGCHVCVLWLWPPALALALVISHRHWAGLGSSFCVQTCSGLQVRHVIVGSAAGRLIMITTINVKVFSKSNMFLLGGIRAPPGQLEEVARTP